MSIPKIITIAGPTASGKTALSISLAQRFNGEIVSADSMQIYLGMDIGTAKATAEEQAAVPHHMIDIISPWENYSVARYTEDADACCREILSRGKLPIVVGGTGLYIDSLVAGRDFADFQEDKSLRAELEQQYVREGGEALLHQLAQFDPERAEKLHASDQRRIIRAIEVYRLTGITITEHDRLTRLKPPAYDAAAIILSFRDRETLYDRINRRVDRMVEDGLFAEVEHLLSEGLSPEATAMQAIGYKEPAQALAGRISAEEAVEQIKMGSRRYAKRQMTWFHKNTSAQWLVRDTDVDPDRDLSECLPYLKEKGIF